MNWYLSKIIFRIVCGEGQHTPQFDEQLRLIAASDEQEAFQKALAIGNRQITGRVGKYHAVVILQGLRRKFLQRGL